MKKSILIILLAFFVQFGLSGQGKISGILLDSESKEVIPFTSVVLFNKQDSIISGVLSNINGEFVFVNVPIGSYYVLTQSVTHNEFKSKELLLSKEALSLKLGKLTLKKSGIELEQVEITTEKAVVKISPSKKTFDAASTGVSSGGTAVDVLNNLPSVNVDQDGNISLRGNTNLRVLIDGKPVGSGPEDVALVISQLPANSIESVEIITVPSAKYDPEGVGGILNIILKKQTKKGLNGGLNVSYAVFDQARMWDKLNTSANLNYRTKKFGINASYSHRRGSYESYGSELAKTDYIDSSLIFNTKTYRLRNNPSHNANLGIDFNLSKSTKVNLSGGLNYSSANANKISELDWDYSTGFSEDIIRNSVKTGDRASYNAQLSVDQKIKKGTLKFVGQYLDATFPTMSDFDEPGIIQREERDNYRNEFINQLDYTLPFSLDTGKLAAKFKFETGLKSTHRSLGEDYLFYDYLSGDYVLNSTISNKLTYQEAVYAGYAMISRTKGGWTSQLGLRAENTDLTSQVSGVDFEQKMLNLFPSLYISKNINDYNTLSLSYAKRIKRPTGRQLNPLPTYANPYHLHIGNAELIPERAHLAELSYLKISKKITLNSTLWYQYRDDRMGRISSTDTSGVTTIQWINFNYHQTAGLELFTNWRITKWLTNVNTITLYRTWVDGSNFAEGYKAVYTGSDIKNNIKIKANKELTFTVTGNYYSQRIAVVGVVLPRYHVDLGMNYKFLKDKMKVSVRFSDVFKTQYFRINTDVDNWTREIKHDWESQMIWLGLNYKFGHHKKRKGKGGIRRSKSRGGDAM